MRKRKKMPSVSWENVPDTLLKQEHRVTRLEILLVVNTALSGVTVLGVRIMDPVLLQHIHLP